MVSTPEAFRIPSCGRDILGVRTEFRVVDAEGNEEVCGLISFHLSMTHKY